MKLKNLLLLLLLLNNSLYSQSNLDNLNCYEDCSLGKNNSCNLMCSTGCFNCGGTTYNPRSQGDNIVRELVGWAYYLHAPDNIDCYKSYCVLDLTFEFTQSFKSEEIANALFCTDCLTFSGSQLPGRANTDIVADYFGLSPLFHRALKINPVIKNYIVDLAFYANLSDVFPGFWLEIFAPVVHTKWNLGLNECSPCSVKPIATTTIGPNLTPACNSNTSTTPPTDGNILTTFPTNYMTVDNTTCALQDLREGLAGQTFGDMTVPWQYGKWSFCPLQKTGLADLNVQLGLNFFESIMSHFGVFIKAIAPTGNKPKAKYLFEPIVGNRGHWELGGGITTHALLWTSPYDDQAAFGIYFKGAVTHVFKGNELRSFDFTKNGFLSKYLLLKEFNISPESIADINLATTYNGNLINAINFNTRNCEVSIDAKGEAALMLSYVRQGLGFDFGYSIYGRTKENVCIKTKCPCNIDELLLGIKGTEGVGTALYSYIDDIITTGLPSNKSLNSTQSEAIISVPTTTATVDNPVELITSYSIGVTYNSYVIPGETNITSPSLDVAYASNPPVLVNCSDLNPNSATTCAQLSNKIFLNFSYRWLDTDWFPHLNLGSEIEFGSNNKCYNTINQWGIWIRGGFVF